MHPAHRLFLGLAAAAAIVLGGCTSRQRGPIEASIIEHAGSAHNDGLSDSSTMEAAIRQATGSGLVRLDQAGQLVAGIAIRWAIVEDGLDGIFRIDTIQGVPAALVARRLRAALAGPDRRLFAYGIQRVTAVTDAVVELRLSEPRSDLLPLLAAPELATLAPASGPLRLAVRRGGDVLLVPRAPAESGASTLRLHGEHVGRAVARFAAGRSALVLGGTFGDLPVVRAAGIAGRQLRFDKASGLFGFAARAGGGVYADPAVIAALGLAIDRDRLIGLIGAPGQTKATTIGGSQIEPPRPDRIAQARRMLDGRTMPLLRVAMPNGPGARMLFRSVAHDWAGIGVVAQAVPPDAPADLALIDRIVPPAELARAACIAAAGCDPADPHALLAPPFIPLSTPLRWSLVAPGLDLFTDNALASHPLDRLRSRSDR